MGGCLITFANKFKNAPLIGMTALNDNNRITSHAGSSLVPSLNPYQWYNHNSKTFLERSFNFVVYMADKILYHCYTFPKLRSMIRKESSFKDTSSPLELGKKSVIFMTNSDASIDGSKQIPANVIPVGGLQIKASGKLPDVRNTIALPILDLKDQISISGSSITC